MNPSQYEVRKRSFDQAIEYANELWECVRTSLMLCGDTGEFDKSEFMIGPIDEDVIIRAPMLSRTKSVSGYSPTFYPMYFVGNLTVMREKFEEKGFNTPEALYIFIELAAKASARLGLKGTFSIGFGSGYGRVRTGWIGEKSQPEESEIFYKMFFPKELFLFKKNKHEWEFHWTSVQERIKSIFDKFSEWQNDPELFSQEVRPSAKTVPMMV